MHFSQFRMFEESEAVNRIWLCVWIVVIGELWKHKNKKIFRNGHIDHTKIFLMALVMGNIESTVNMFFLFKLVLRS